VLSPWYFYHTLPNPYLKRLVVEYLHVNRLCESSAVLAQMTCITDRWIDGNPTLSIYYEHLAKVDIHNVACRTLGLCVIAYSTGSVYVAE